LIAKTVQHLVKSSALPPITPTLFTSFNAPSHLIHYSVSLGLVNVVSQLSNGFQQSSGLAMLTMIARHTRKDGIGTMGVVLYVTHPLSHA
jgi:hypothetical protein